MTDYRTELVIRVFRLASERIKSRSDSLSLFLERWHRSEESKPKSESGIEAWLKVEFIAAIPRDVAKVRAGGRKDGRVPDLKLENPKNDNEQNEKPVLVELKTGTNWDPTHSHPKGWSHYHGHALFFLCGTPDSLESKRLEIEKLGFPCDLDWICSGLRPDRNKPTNFLFGFVDLTAREFGSEQQNVKKKRDGPGESDGQADPL